ncbi:hypothetical protein [Cernens ardua]|uniref:hypothetical protein n=1 Tax=Cernens ardua TaxID=3402176 RepID=UPI003F94FAB0
MRVPVYKRYTSSTQAAFFMVALCLDVDHERLILFDIPSSILLGGQRFQLENATGVPHFQTLFNLN